MVSRWVWTLEEILLPKPTKKLLMHSYMLVYYYWAWKWKAFLKVIKLQPSILQKLISHIDFFFLNLCIYTHSVDVANWVSSSGYQRWRMTHHNNISHFIILVSWFISVKWDRHTHGSPHCAPLNTLTHTNSVINKAWEPRLQEVITPWSPAKLWWEVSGPWLQKPLTRSLYSSFWSHFSLKCHSHGFLEGIYVSCLE